MKFELELDIDTFNKETSERLGVVFTEPFVRVFLTKNPQLLGYIAGTTFGSYDTFEREWLMSELTQECIGKDVPLNMDSEKTSEEFVKDWVAFISSSDRIDRAKSKQAMEDWKKEY